MTKIYNKIRKLKFLVNRPVVMRLCQSAIPANIRAISLARNQAGLYSLQFGSNFADFI